MIPILLDRRSWSSGIGNFIINFGVLDYLVLEFLELRLSPERFAAIKDKHFQDRITCIVQSVQQQNIPTETRERSACFFARLAPIRELRNHIAHGCLLMRLDDAGNNLVLTVSLPKNLVDAYSPDSKQLSFDGLQQALTELNKLIEEFSKLREFWQGGERTS